MGIHRLADGFVRVLFPGQLSGSAGHITYERVRLAKKCSSSHGRAIYWQSAVWFFRIVLFPEKNSPGKILGGYPEKSIHLFCITFHIAGPYFADLQQLVIRKKYHRSCLLAENKVLHHLHRLLASGVPYTGPGLTVFLFITTIGTLWLQRNVEDVHGRILQP